MKERPILFSSAMVRALLAGTKTQTRRMVKLSADSIEPLDGYPDEWSPWKDGERQHSIMCPYGQPGDRLWVRESWAKCTVCFGVDWLADANKDRHCRHCDSPLGKGRPSIHLPRSCSRITLELTEVRVERLQDISLDDASAEGVEELPGARWKHYHPNPTAYTGAGCTCRRESYRSLWESINGPGSWEKNPWVWCLSFRKLEGSAP